MHRRKFQKSRSRATRYSLVVLLLLMLVVGSSTFAQGNAPKFKPANHNAARMQQETSPTDAPADVTEEASPAPTETATELPTETPTDAPTAIETATEIPTENPTQAPTGEPTVEATETAMPDPVATGAAIEHLRHHRLHRALWDCRVERRRISQPHPSTSEGRTYD